MPQTTRVATHRSILTSPSGFACLLIFLSIAAVGFVSRYALLTTLVDVLMAGVVLVPVVLGGLGLISLFRLGTLPRRWKLIFGAALGIGVVSTMVLVAGLLGSLGRNMWIVVLAMLTVTSVFHIMRAGKLTFVEYFQEMPNQRDRVGSWRFLWIVAAPFLTLALLSAANAPGFVWREEGFGYDVLEYHLQLPKEYLENGRISYIPHNVYANFPANVEMLYLLAMIVHGDIPDSGTVANMIHLFLGVLTVATAWAIGREVSPKAGIVCGVIVATTGWLDYLSGLAYVENGMLFFDVCALGAMLQALHLTQRSKRGNPVENAAAGQWCRWVALSGVMAGLACGCKYTAAVLIALPLLPAIAMLRVGGTQKLWAGLMFLATSFIAFSPWMVKNVVMTGNPVFPLVNTVFRASPPGWGEEQTRHWDRGHSLKPTEGTLSSRAHCLWSRVAGDAGQRFGPAVLLLGIIGMLRRRRDRTDVALISMLVFQLLIWMLATHEYARFAVPIIIPLAILAGRAIPPTVSTLRTCAVSTALIVGAAWNFGFAASRHIRESARGAPASLFYDGEVPGFEYLGVVNKDLPPDAKVLLVGESRAFYFQRAIDYCVAFNRSAFLEMIHNGKDASAIMDWLGVNGFTHVLVHWGEVRRLDGTYGLSPPTSTAELQRAISDLERAGLELDRAFVNPLGPGAHRYVDLFVVPRGRASRGAR